MNSPPRTDNPCTCGGTRVSLHYADCLSLQPKQPAPGDEADTLTLLARHVRSAHGIALAAFNSWTEFETRAMDLIADARAERARIVQNSRHGEIRKQAFLELAEELAEMDPEDRDKHIRRIIDNQQ